MEHYKADPKTPVLAVHIPKVNLRVEDVAYLRGLRNQNGARCELGESKLARLRLLGLIERTEVSACPDVVKKADEEIREGIKQARVALQKRDFKKLARVANEIGSAQWRKEAKPGNTITEAGRRLLDKGEVVVAMSKAGCK